MSFVTAVAGPSRIPYGAAQAARVACTAAQCARRGYAQQARRKKDEDEETGPKPDAAAFPADVLPGNFEEWLANVGFKYKRPGTGRARWLGGSVPYASNPSFRPPPPLSNDLMNVLSAELSAQKRTIGQISQAYNVSKHRLEAIRKLKEVEAEFVRQKLPLQYAYQESMETLLGVESPVGADKKASTEARRMEELNRLEHPSTAAELQEEHDFSEDKHKGAFSRKSIVSGGSVESLAWEMKDEAVYLREQREATAEAAARKAAELAEVASGTDADSLADKAEQAGGQPIEQVAKTPAHITRTGNDSLYRFVDISKDKGFKYKSDSFKPRSFKKK